MAFELKSILDSLKLSTDGTMGDWITRIETNKDKFNHFTGRNFRPLLEICCLPLTTPSDVKITNIINKVESIKNLAIEARMLNRIPIKGRTVIFLCKFGHDNYPTSRQISVLRLTKEIYSSLEKLKKRIYSLSEDDFNKILDTVYGYPYTEKSVIVDYLSNLIYDRYDKIQSGAMSQYLASVEVIECTNSIDETLFLLRNKIGFDRSKTPNNECYRKQIWDSLLDLKGEERISIDYEIELNNFRINHEYHVAKLTRSYNEELEQLEKEYQRDLKLLDQKYL